MITFGIDTSGRTVSVAITQDGQLLFESFWNGGLTHSETLMTLVDTAFRSTNLTPQQVDVWGVCSGPGSFTGLRIGIAAVKGLSFGTGAECAAVSSLEALAQGLVGEGTVISALDARRGQVYWAAFDLGPEHTRLTPDTAASADSLAEFVENCKKPLFFVGDGAALCYNKYDTVTGVQPCPPVMQCCRAAAVCLTAEHMKAQGLCTAPDQLLPSYHRLSQAERERQMRLEGEPVT